MTARRPLPAPEPGAEAAASWLRDHLGDLTGDDAPPSPRFRGGQRAADAALAGFDVQGYAARRNEVWPPERRGASGLSPYIRHGLLTLPRVWAHVDGGSRRDVDRFRDELSWQEYARHLYARLGERTARPLRYAPPGAQSEWEGEPWPPAMACVALVRDELVRDGWIVNQTRMWMASQWSVRAGAAWREGEDLFFRHLLDGSRAANRLGWQWTIGTATGKPYGFSRWQVDKRAPGLCAQCALASTCPIEAWPDAGSGTRIEPAEALRAVETETTGAGPETVERNAEPEAVWITAESLGDDDPALAANPQRPALFVFDETRLARWRLSAKRMAFLVETLADLAARRPVELWRDDPARVLSGRPLAATYTPVPGWRSLASRLDLAEVHPWPWLRRPHPRPLPSFSQWRRGFPEASRGA